MLVGVEELSRVSVSGVFAQGILPCVSVNILFSVSPLDKDRVSSGAGAGVCQFKQARSK